MILKNSFNYINQFFFFFSNKTRNFYLNSIIYNKKISKTENRKLEYKPSSDLIDCIIKYKKKKNKIEDFSLQSIWESKNIKKKDYEKLHNFFWLFTLDLKSSKNITQSIILNWINSNSKYNSENWEIDILSKRVIAWISNSKLTYEDSSEDYKEKFNKIIQKQINHLINEIDRSENLDNKVIGCSAIILAGLAYQNYLKYLEFGLNLLKKIIKYSLDADGFPKSRNIRQLNFYYKYFILIREWLKDSQSDVPEYIEEAIYNLGNAYALITQSLNKSVLFNGNNESKNDDFDNYLLKFGYKFKNENHEIGGYSIQKNKKIALIMDVGQSPEKKFSSDYQMGALSFEIISNQNKIICNSGYFQNYKHRLNELSKATATHSTLILDSSSSCKLQKIGNKKSVIEKGLKIFDKSSVFKKNYWNIAASHNGYLKKYGVVHHRLIEFYPEQNKFIGTDNLLRKKNYKSTHFEIRFHLTPSSKIMKTQDKKSIFIEVDKEGWKFTCDNYDINLETGLYFGKKNSFTENQNIFISGMTLDQNQIIKWVLIKI
tara:strand:+ start:74 stop:1705 length:1632 start_codon:yes stop_codon:yes gene_type:complete